MHIDVALTNISIAYRNQAYVFDQIFPMVPVAKQTNKYFTFGKNAWFRDETAARAPGSPAKEADFTLSTDNYVCVEKALAKRVTDEDQENADAPLQPFAHATEFVSDQILKAMEIDILGLVFGTGWAASATPGTLWSSDASDPLTDIETAMVTVAKAIGREPNTGVIGRGLWRYLKNHPDVVDRMKYGGAPANPAFVTMEGVASLVGLEKLVKSVAVQDTGPEGGTASIDFIGGTHMWIGYVSPGPALMTPSAGYTFTYKNRQVSRFREDRAHTDIVECRSSWDSKVTGAHAGYLIKSAA